MKVAGTEEKPSNPINSLDASFPSFDVIFQDLHDWENQLQDVDFNAIEERKQEMLEADQAAKRGGPSPC